MCFLSLHVRIVWVRIRCRFVRYLDPFFFLRFVRTVGNGLLFMNYVHPIHLGPHDFIVRLHGFFLRYFVYVTMRWNPHLRRLPVFCLRVPSYAWIFFLVRLLELFEHGSAIRGGLFCHKRYVVFGTVQVLFRCQFVLY